MKNCLMGFAAIFFMSSCASLVGFEDGRTNGEENYSITVSANSVQTPDFADGTGFLEDVGIRPNLELSYRYGLTDKLDFGAKANSFMHAGINTKYQMIGDRQSKFAASIGAEIGSFAAQRILYLQVPLFLSYHPNPKLTFYASPRYVYQRGSLETSDYKNIYYFGSSAGVLYGKRHKIGIDFGIHQLRAPELNKTKFLTNIGLGGKFYFGSTV